MPWRFLWPHEISILVADHWHLTVFIPGGDAIMSQMWPWPSKSLQQGWKIDLGGSQWSGPSNVSVWKRKQLRLQTWADLGSSLCSATHWIVTLGKSLYFLQASVYPYVEGKRDYLPIQIWAFWGPRVGNRGAGGNPEGLCLMSLHLSPLSPLFYKKSTLQVGGEFIAPHFWPQVKLTDHLSMPSPHSQERIWLAEPH